MTTLFYEPAAGKFVFFPRGLGYIQGLCGLFSLKISNMGGSFSSTE